MLGLETSLGVSIAHLDMPLADIVAALSWKPAAIAGVADRHGRPIGAGEPANLTVFDPDVEWDGGARPLGEQEPQHALRRHALARQGPPHDLRRGRRRRDGERPDDPGYSCARMDVHATRLRNLFRSARSAGRYQQISGWRGGRAMSRETIRDGALVLADGSVFEGELIGAEAPSRDRRGRVQHRDDRLPGGDHRPELRGPDHHVHHRPPRQLRREPDRRRVPRHVLPGHRDPRTVPPAQQPPRHRWPRRHAGHQRRSGHRRHRHPPAHQDHPRHRRHPRRVRIGQRSRTARRRAARAGHRRRRPRRLRSPRRSATRSHPSTRPAGGGSSPSTTG